MGRAGRLAAVLPAPRPDREGHGRGRERRGRQVSAAQTTARSGMFIPDGQSPIGPPIPERPTWPKLVKDYKGREADRRGRSRSIRRRRTSKPASSGSTLPGGIKVALLAEEDARRNGPRARSCCATATRERSRATTRGCRFLPQLMHAAAPRSSRGSRFRTSSTRPGRRFRASGERATPPSACKPSGTICPAVLESAEADSARADVPGGRIRNAETRAGWPASEEQLTDPQSFGHRRAPPHSSIPIAKDDVRYVAPRSRRDRPRQGGGR